VNRLFSTPDEGIFQGRTNDNIELAKAWAGTTLAFAVAQFGASRIFSSGFVQFLLIAAVVCGLGFVLHELAHRVVARNYGAEAHFVANNGWLLLSVVIAFAGFFIAAPGAVWHRGYLTPRQGGLIALAGPVANLVLSVVFLIGLILLAAGVVPATEWAFDLCFIGFSLNAWIGLFNMIPAGPFDGAKVLEWSPLVFGITVAIGILLTFVLGRGPALSALLGFFSGGSPF
jgi:Zn-dependent protease